MRVAVTGAGGQTGGHAFRKMLAQPDRFQPIGITRSEESRQALLKDTGAPPEQVVAVDLAAESDLDVGRILMGALMGCTALIIGTSAKVKPTGGVNEETGRPNMGFPDGQPYQVDWIAQQRQIDVCRVAGVQHIVLCSSMGGTNPENMLNKFGKNDDGTGGNILLWKRKAEKHLIDSGITYTVVHPGGLLNEPGGKRVLRVGVDDNIIEAESRSIPREDVAEVLVQSLIHKDFKNRSFDIVADPDSGSAVSTDFATLLGPLSGGNCDYSLGQIPDEAMEASEKQSMSA